MQELLFKSILNPLPASETANAQRLLMYRNRNKKSGDDNKKFGDDKFERRAQRAPPPQILTSPASPRGGNRAHKNIPFFSFPAAPIPAACTELVAAAIKKSATTSLRGGLGEHPPQILTSPALPGGGNRVHKKIFFFPLPCSSDSYSCRNQKMRLKMTELQISTKVKIKLQIYKKMKIELHIYKEI
jgi:hypothetical protein